MQMHNAVQFVQQIISPILHPHKHIHTTLIFSALKIILNLDGIKCTNC